MKWSYVTYKMRSIRKQIMLMLMKIQKLHVIPKKNLHIRIKKYSHANKGPLFFPSAQNDWLWVLTWEEEPDGGRRAYYRVHLHWSFLQHFLSLLSESLSFYFLLRYRAGKYKICIKSATFSWKCSIQYLQYMIIWCHHRKTSVATDR